MRKRQRQASLPGYELGDYIQESIAFLQEHEPAEGYFVGFSGGKDSIATLRLCQLAGVRHRAFYSCTRIDPPEVMRFIKREYPQVEWLFPKKSFYQYIQEKMPPLRHMRWCCDYLKKRPSNQVPLKSRVVGIRAEESFKRAQRPRIANYDGKRTHYKPIFHWPEWAVWDFIEAQKLPYPSLYDEGWNRIGCVCCPFIFGRHPAAIKRISLHKDRWPGLWRAFEHAVKRWFLYNRNGSDYAAQTPEDFWESYLTGTKIYKMK